MISQLHANKLLEVTAGVSSITMPTTVYLGFCANEPAAANGAVTGEPTDKDSYARKLVGGSGSSVTKYFAAASGGVIKNKAEIHMNAVREEGGYGTMKWWFLSDSVGGNAIIWGKINGDNGVTVGKETVPIFYENELQASIDVPLT